MLEMLTFYLIYLSLLDGKDSSNPHRGTKTNIWTNQHLFTWNYERC